MIKLPTEHKQKVDDLFHYTYMFVGEKKVGKTSLCAQFPDHFILEGEPGNADHVTCNRVDIHNWDECLDYTEALSKEPDYCKVLVIDDLPSIYQHCLKFVRGQFGLEDNQKSNYDIWGVTRNMFTRWVQHIQQLPCGKIYTAHDKIREVEIRNGGTISQLETTMSGQCKEIMDAWITFCGFIIKDSAQERYMQIQGDRWIKAYNGLESDHFIGKDGKPLTRINLGKSPQEAYQAFIRAYNSKGKTTPTIKKPILLKKQLKNA